MHNRGGGVGVYQTLPPTVYMVYLYTHCCNTARFGVGRGEGFWVGEKQRPVGCSAIFWYYNLTTGRKSAKLAPECRRANTGLSGPAE